MSWNAVNTGLPTLSIGPLVVVSDRPSAPLLFAASTTDGIFLSANNGTDWNSASTGLPIASILDVAVIDTDTPAPIAFVGTWNGGLFRSTNDGTSWEPANTGLTDNTIYSFAVAGTNILAGTDSGIFLSTDSGANWENVGEGFSPNNSFEYIAIIGSTVFAESDSIVDMFGDDTAFAWRRPLSEMITTSAVSEPQAISSQFQIYPNPTSSTLHIVSSSSDITITDLIGRTWLHSVNGAHDLDVSELPQGVYSISDGTSRAEFVKE
jgi:hypothetical protein